jgi:hypothetical protein
MRAVAVAVSLLGALVSLYVPIDAYRNSLNTGFPTPVAFFVVAALLALVGIIGAILTWRGTKLGTAVLLLGTIGGLVVWPWLVPALIFLLATMVSAATLWMASRATQGMRRLA